MGTFAGGNTYYVTSVDFGIESATANPTPGTQPVTVRLHTQTTGTFPGGTRTQIATATVNVANQTLTVLNVPLAVTVPEGTTQLIMEVNTPDGTTTQNSLFIGSNTAAETAPSYISAPDCALPNPVTTASIGFPNMHIVMNVNGICPTPTPAPVSISGTVTYCSGNGVPGVTMTRTGALATSGSTTTDALGNYTFTGLPSGGTYVVTPSIANRTPGSANINGTDVLAVRRHFLGIALIPAGCRRVAADVNGGGTGVINGVDVIAIQRFFLGITSGTANVGKYQFTPANRTYTGIVSNQTAQNYDTLIFGDVATPFAGRAGGPSPTETSDGTSAPEDLP